VLQPPRFWPAVGQGALAIQIRAADRRAHAAVLPLDDPPTHSAVRAERACLAALAGGCLAPIGAWSRGTATGKLALGACVLEMVGRTVSRLVVEEDVREEDESPEGLGARVAAVLVGRGADRMLERMRDPAASATHPDGGTDVTGVTNA
jgi:hydroxymethylbilane synthase